MKRSKQRPPFDRGMFHMAATIVGMGLALAPMGLAVELGYRFEQGLWVSAPLSVFMLFYNLIGASLISCGKCGLSVFSHPNLIMSPVPNSRCTGCGADLTKVSID